MGIDTAAMTADLLFVRAFSHGEDIFYLTFDASTPLQATLERGTFTPVLGLTPFANASAHPEGARSAIFTFVNGQVGPESPPAQGGGHVVADGLLAETANVENVALLEALRAGGDAHNVLDSFPTLDDPDLAALYSPLWDLRVGVWSADAVAAGENVAQTDANAIRQLAAAGTVTSPGASLSVRPTSSSPARCWASRTMRQKHPRQSRRRPRALLRQTTRRHLEASLAPSGRATRGTSRAGNRRHPGASKWCPGAAGHPVSSAATVVGWPATPEYD